MRVFLQDTQGENAYIRTDTPGRDCSKGIAFEFIDKYPFNL